jgi:prepilin-type N-terminal cleavage/methylation domain-containing protein
MFYFLKNLKNKKSGFTLIETLVAISIFSIAVVGMMSVLSSGMTDTISSKKKISATFLAQEGIEYIRNLRDTYVLYYGSYTDGWNQFNDRVVSSCGPGKECYFDDGTINYSNLDMPITELKIFECSSVGSCPALYFDSSNSKFNSSGVGDRTGFVRSITVEKLAVGETKIVSTVSWDEGSKKVSMSESLFNWVE